MEKETARLLHRVRKNREKKWEEPSRFKGSGNTLGRVGVSVGTLICYSLGAHQGLDALLEEVGCRVWNWEVMAFPDQRKLAL